MRTDKKYPDTMTSIGMVAPPIEPRQEIMSELEDLGHALDGLEKEFAALATTLVPICATPNETGALQGGRPWAMTTAPLAERIQSMVRQAYNLRENMVGVHSRVRL